VRSIAAAIVVLAFAAFTVTATAGNPHGVPPGQQQASGSTAATASTQANAGAQAQGKAQAKGGVATSASAKAKGPSVKASGRARGAAHSSVHASVAASTTVQAQPTVSAGVKPSSATTHNTLAPASSNATKLYGNGKTAGQIATQAGFGSWMLYGPGNSQPHKVICGPHNVDVHALKAHAAKCTTAAAASVAASLSPAAAASLSPAASAQASVAGSVAAQTPTTAATQPKSAAAGVKGEEASHGGGVLGARAELASNTKRVSRAILATVRKGTLPFTGLGLWMPVLFGLALIAGGYGLRRKAASLS
jgi:hypothetical protein